MKILFITEYFPVSEKVEVRGGAEARCYYVASQLAKSHEVTVIASRERGNPKYDRFCDLDVIRCGPERSYSQAGSILARALFIIDAYRTARHIRVDFIEGETFLTYPIAYWAAKAQKVPAIAFYNDVLLGDWISAFGWLWGSVWEILERLFLKLRWKAMIANSHTTKNKLVRHHIPADHIYVVYCPLDLNEFKNLEVKKFQRPTIVSIARLVKYKNLDTLLRAIAIVHQSIPDIQCKIIGSGPEGESLQKLARDLEINELVEFMGFIPNRKDVLHMLKRSHIFCLPSSIEGFGIVTIEALASGIPYVNSDIPATREITENGQGGLLFSPGKSDDLAAKVIELLENKQMYAEKASAGIVLVNKYDMVEIVPELESIYLKLLDRLIA